MNYNMHIITLVVSLLVSMTNSQSSSARTISNPESLAVITPSKPGIIGNDILSKIGWYETTYTVTTTLCTLAGPSSNSTYCGSFPSAPSANSITSTAIPSSKQVQSGAVSNSSTGLAPGAPTNEPPMSNGTNSVISAEKPSAPYWNQTSIASRKGQTDTGPPQSLSMSHAMSSTAPDTSTASAGSTQIVIQPSSTIFAPQETDSLAHRVNADGKDAMAFWVAISAVLLLELGVNMPNWV